MDTWSNEYIICPYCECEHEENYDEQDIFYVEGNHRYECAECRLVFKVDTEVSYHYATEELEE